MAKYPTDPVPQLPYSLEPEWKTVISVFDGGNEQRRQKWTFPKYNVSLTYNALNATSFQKIWEFYQARKGSYEPFWFFTLEETTWTGLYVGVGDGTSTSFDLPGYGSSATTVNVYMNGSAISSTSWSISTKAGTTGSDLILFDGATYIPTSTQTLTVDFYGNMRIRCRFSDDKMTKEGMAGKIYKTGLNLKGLNAT